MNANGTGSSTSPTGDEPDWQPLNQAGPEADVLSTITDSPDPVPAGGILTYTAQAKNLVGPDPATGVTLTVNLPASVFYISATPTPGQLLARRGHCDLQLRQPRRGLIGRRSRSRSSPRQPGPDHRERERRPPPSPTRCPATTPRRRPRRSRPAATRAPRARPRSAPRSCRPSATATPARRRSSTGRRSRTPPAVRPR